MPTAIRRLLPALLAACAATAAAAPALATDGRSRLAAGRCPERVQLGFGETAADIARRCGVTVEAIERFNPGLDRDRPQLGVSITVPRPALPSPALGTTRNGFVPVPTPPGALGR